MTDERDRRNRSAGWRDRPVRQEGDKDIQEGGIGGARRSAKRSPAARDEPATKNKRARRRK